MSLILKTYLNDILNVLDLHIIKLLRAKAFQNIKVVPTAIVILPFDDYLKEHGFTINPAEFVAEAKS